MALYSQSALGGSPLRLDAAVITLAACSVLIPGWSAAQTVTATVAAGTAPYAVAVNPVTNKVYAVDTDDASVTVIDGATNATTTVSVGMAPKSVAVNPVTNRIYVANSGSNDVTVIEGATNTTSTIPVGTWPLSVAVNAATNKIYVANQSSNDVTVIDGATNLTDTVAVGNQPRSLVVNPATDEIYVGNFGSGDVTVIDGATNATSTIANVAGGDSIAVNPATNKIYVVSTLGSYNLSVINGATQAIISQLSWSETPSGSVVVNPVTNKIYVGDDEGRNVTVIDGAADAVTGTVPAGFGCRNLAVDAATNTIYTANSVDGSVTAINGATGATTLVPVGAAVALALNPVTNKIYVLGPGSGVAVIDGSTNRTTALQQLGTTPTFVVANPATNKIYVANQESDDVTVVDGATNGTIRVPTGPGPGALAVNPVTNRVYVANTFDGSVTIVDGATNATSTVPAGTPSSGPRSVAVNPVTNRIYMANYPSNSVTVIDGATNSTTDLGVGSQPWSVAVNPVTNKAYVANYGSNSVTVIDGATHATTGVPVGVGPRSLAVDSVTNKVYVANALGDTVTVIDGATNGTATVVAGLAPREIAANPGTGKIYVVNQGSSTMTVIDGPTNTTVTVPTGGGPAAVAVNAATNKIYVANDNSGDLSVIDGATNTVIATVPVGSNPFDLAINPVTSTVYVSSSTADEVAVLREQDGSVIPLTTTVTPLPGDVTVSATPTFSLGAASTFAPIAPPVRGIFAQVDSRQGPWEAALPSGAFHTLTTATLGLGTHILYVYAVDGQEATSCFGSSPAACSPLVGSINAYVFTVVATPPGAPTVGVATPGNNSVSVAFTAPANDGGSPITGYTATCGAQSASGVASPIAVGGLTNGVALACTVVARNAMGESAPSAPSNSVVPGPMLSINDRAVTEGNAGTQLMTFTVTRSGGTGAMTFRYSTVDVTATAGSDYAAVTNGLGTIAAGGAGTATFSITIAGDAVYETNETFNVILSSPTGGSILDGTGVGAITNNDAAPTLAIDKVTLKAEGNVGTTSMTFTVTRTGQTQLPATFNYATGDVTTTAGADYVAIPLAAGSVPPGGGTGVTTIVVTVNGDVLDENNETFNVFLSNPANATITTATGLGTITDDDATPALVISDVAVTEGDAGTSLASFTVTLSAPSGRSVTVTATTIAGTAAAVTDFINPGPLTLTFDPGVMTRIHSVQVVGDVLNEALTESFSVKLSGAVNATIADNLGVATISDNDPLPALSIDDVSATEGNSGTKLFTFTVTLSAPSGRNVTVTRATSNGTAVAPTDYSALGASVLTFTPGQTTKTVAVTVKGDTTPEPNETFNVNLSAAGNATIAKAVGTGTILNDEP